MPAWSTGSPGLLTELRAAKLPPQWMVVHQLEGRVIMLNTTLQSSWWRWWFLMGNHFIIQESEIYFGFTLPERMFPFYSAAQTTSITKCPPTDPWPAPKGLRADFFLDNSIKSNWFDFENMSFLLGSQIALWSRWWRCMFGNNLVSCNQAESPRQSSQPHPRPQTPPFCLPYMASNLALNFNIMVTYWKDVVSSGRSYNRSRKQLFF